MFGLWFGLGFVGFGFVYLRFRYVCNCDSLFVGSVVFGSWLLCYFGCFNWVAAWFTSVGGCSLQFALVFD